MLFLYHFYVRQMAETPSCHKIPQYLYFKGKKVWVDERKNCVILEEHLCLKKEL